MINFARLEDNIFIGNSPATSVDVARLKTMKITAVMSLQSDEDFRTHKINPEKLRHAYMYNDIKWRRFPILDFDPVDLGNRLAEPVKVLNELLQSGHRVYVHCNAGVCRAPATVLGYLCHYRGMTIDEGLNYIREQRPQANPYISAVQQALNQLGSGDSK